MYFDAIRLNKRRMPPRPPGAVPRKVSTLFFIQGLIILWFQSVFSGVFTFFASQRRAPFANVFSMSRGSSLRGCREASLIRKVNGGSSLELWKAGPAEIYTGPGQKAMYLLKENPELFDATVEEELEALARQREEDELRSTSTGVVAKDDTLILRRRMDEVRSAERQSVTTELLYLKVCKKFMDSKVPLIPPLKDGGFIKFGSIDLKGLTTDIYSKDALDLVRDHLFSIIGSDDQKSVMGGLGTVQIALIQASQVYAMSSFFGYYLRRMDARYQLEKLAGSLGAWGEQVSGSRSNSLLRDQDDATSLKDYISNFGPREMMKMTSVASKEAQSALERQVAALFGDIRVLQQRMQDVLGVVTSPTEANLKLQEAIDNGQLESIHLTGDDVRRMVLEAVAFGAVLTDVEKQVETMYELTPKRALGDDMGSGDAVRFLPE